MAIETEADRLAFFSPEDFGSEGDITPDSGPLRTVAGIYDAAHLTRGVTQSNGYDNQADVGGGKPVFHARTSDLAGIKSGRASVTIYDVSSGARVKVGDFTVHDVKADGTGLTLLKLMKA